MVRDQDRIQARINEANRIKFFDQQYKLQTSKYERMQKKDAHSCARCDANRGKYCKDHNWEEYEEIMEEGITKMWRRMGVTDRDWAKFKVIYFDDKSRLCIENKDKF